MRHSNIADRYAKALYSIAQDAGVEAKTLNELRELSKALEGLGESLKGFLSPLISSDVREQAVLAAIDGKGFSEDTVQFLKLLITNNRLGVFSEITAAYQDYSDKKMGMVRGSVESPTALVPEERSRIEQLISKVTKKKAILEYKQKPSLIGGLFARVGSYTFDDSLDTQLNLMADYLKRRSN